ncbi:hypothetical protein HK098_007780 [Nowakowskiella sp. JEL0407]|nr:hypothetical protein HK098_007780 [Nowakowskiella sp. JEL0407]
MSARFLIAAVVVILAAIVVEAHWLPPPPYKTQNWEKNFPGTSYKWRNQCRDVWHRREWRSLKKWEQTRFLNAMKCMFTKKSVTSKNAPGAKNRFDDFSGVHIRQTDNIHLVGHFLPWHRLMMSVFEEYLHAECGYEGGIPYWDWSLDAGLDKITKSPIFAKDAFGGNGDFRELTANDTVLVAWEGRTGGGCVKDGVFKDIKINMGPGNTTEGHPRCIARDFVPPLSLALTKENVDFTLSAKDFYTFDYRLEGKDFFQTGFNLSYIGVHSAGHFVIGGSLGTMNNQYSSSSDPTFYMHHAQIDRLWWLWQQRDLKKRIYDISGPEKPEPLFGPILVHEKNVTLDFPLHLNELTAPWNITIRDMMNTVGGPLCYDYI